MRNCSRFLLLLLFMVVHACGQVKPEISQTSATASRSFYCPNGFQYKTSSRLCESSESALGPFTLAMTRNCENAGGGEACRKELWNLEFARSIRGGGVCPPGANSQEGLCIEGDNAYGPFTTAHVQACRQKSGGSACESMRWERDFALNTLPQDDFTFPLSGPALLDYVTPPRSFGSCRDNCTRRHAAADLYANTGTVVRAVGAGTVIDFYEFYLGTYALVVDHGAFVVRYGEIKGALPAGIRVGATVRQGQGIAYVGRLVGLSNDMVHFERYSGKAEGPLTVTSNYPYQRRSDLVDPTKDLQAWKYPQ